MLGELVGGERYAVVGGISDYSGTADDLDFADNDAQDMYLALTSVYGFHGENVRYLVDIEGTEANGGTLVATRENILIAIDELRDRVDSSDDEVVLEGMADKYDSLPEGPDVTIEEAFDYANANCFAHKPTIGDSFGDDLLP